ncbi:MAG: hypothetical protein ACREV6_21980 [Clostridium sp.]|uniref:hypothetical protein n=1 Tax=Clostridium sp. TaxID=1506 RepID=UPI003D6D955F
MEKSSFFNSIGDDREYFAQDFAQYFASFIGNGVFPLPSTNLQIISNSNMTVTLKLGKSWIDGYFYINTDDLILPLENADGVLKRIDRVVIQFNTINRTITANIKKGTFASAPIAPTLQRDADVYELGIADIYINKGAVSIVQADITDLRANTSLCGIVHGVVQQLDTTTFFNQYQDWITSKKAQYNAELVDWTAEKQLQYNVWYDTNTQNFFDMFNTWYNTNTNTWTNDFNSWFNAVKGQLTTDVAGNLYTLITTLEQKVDSHWADNSKHIDRMLDPGTSKHYKLGILNGLLYYKEVL